MYFVRHLCFAFVLSLAMFISGSYKGRILNVLRRTVKYLYKQESGFRN